MLKWLKSWDSVVFRKRCTFPTLPESLLPVRSSGGGAFSEQSNMSENFRKREESGERYGYYSTAYANEYNLLSGISSSINSRIRILCTSTGRMIPLGRAT